MPETTVSHRGWTVEDKRHKRRSDLSRTRTSVGLSFTAPEMDTFVEGRLSEARLDG